MSWLAAHWLPLVAVVAITSSSLGFVWVWWSGRADRREARRVKRETAAAFERDQLDFSAEELGVWAGLVSMALYGEDATANDRP